MKLFVLLFFPFVHSRTVTTNQKAYWESQVDDLLEASVGSGTTVEFVQDDLNDLDCCDPASPTSQTNLLPLVSVEFNSGITLSMSPTTPILLAQSGGRCRHSTGRNRSLVDGV